MQDTMSTVLSKALQCYMEAVNCLSHILLLLIKLCSLTDDISTGHKVSIRLCLDCVVLTHFLRT